MAGGDAATPDTGWYVAPTLLADVPADAIIADNEVFGPVLTVTTYDTIEEAFAKVADDPANTLEYTGTPEFDEASTFLTEYGFEARGRAHTAR